MTECKLDAHAKLNLTLDIVKKREDGYHDLEMVMQSISLHDTLTIRCETGSGDILVETDHPTLSPGRDNIAYRAAEAFFRATGIPHTGVHIFIEKRIPMEAGMAGGSADGAGVLRGLAEVYCPELPRSQLEEIGSQVGSDVPYCVRGGTALARGRGEIRSELPSMPFCYLLI